MNVNVYSTALDGEHETVLKGLDDSGLSVFQQDWWVKIARGSRGYREALVFEEGIVVGRLPFAIRRTLTGFLPSGNFDWSRLGGPIIRQDLSRNAQAEVLDKLIDQLPRGIPSRFVCRSDVSYADLVNHAFQKAGFAHSVQVTYLRRPGDANVMDGFTGKHRKHIRSAAKKLEIVEMTAGEFTSFYDLNLQAEGPKRSYSPLAVAHELIIEGQRRGQARVIAARDKKPAESNGVNGVRNPFEAAVACVWDNERYYFWMSTRRRRSADSHKPNSEAIKVLAFESIAHAEALGLIFDADGVSSPGSSYLYTKLLGLREEDVRNIYQRTTTFARVSDNLWRGIRKTAVSLGLRSGPPDAECAETVLENSVPRRPEHGG